MGHLALAGFHRLSRATPVLTRAVGIATVLKTMLDTRMRRSDAIWKSFGREKPEGRAVERTREPSPAHPRSSPPLMFTTGRRASQSSVGPETGCDALTRRERRPARGPQP